MTVGKFNNNLPVGHVIGLTLFVVDSFFFGYIKNSWITKMWIAAMGCFHYIQLLQDDREEVIQAWYMDDSDEDQRLPHHRDPKEFVSLDQLASEYFKC